MIIFIYYHLTEISTPCCYISLIWMCIPHNQVTIYWRICTRYTQVIYRVYTGYVQGIHRLYTGYVQGIHRVFTGQTAHYLEYPSSDKEAL